MDRNYFLSYSHIAFLLLLSTIGKLNTGFISAAVSNSELLHYTGVNTTDLHSRIAVTYLQKSIEDTNILQADKGRFYNHTLQCNFPIPRDKDSISFAINGFELISVWKTRIQYVEYFESTLLIFEKIKRFYVNSFKLIDGFKFIIKIPDKLATLFVQ
ncbi:hypothetical protein MP478_11840 [Chryseobacterium sp. WG14]|uniref:hypothetical protein n=1 Tax=unclassified Chryseobacterium TaxID=2593645 RepID=UPI001E3EE26F|nr:MULTISPECIES: hypothetical protein [unclassified Chryseobacterium]MCQ9640069.1 hypothetical protein [Chryseobacterium sp. WG14]